MSRQIEIALGVILVVLSSAALIFFGLREETRMQHNEEQQLAEAIEAGASLFDINCKGCHGPQGKGLPGIAPALNDPHFFTDRMAEVGWTGTFEDFVTSTVSAGRLNSTRPEYVGGGKPAMPAWAEEFGGPLRQDQIRNLAMFILNWEEEALGGVSVVVLATPTPAAADPETRGRIVYEAKGCGACHALGDISQGVVGPNLTRIGEVAATRVAGLAPEEYIRQSIVNPNAFVVEGFPEGVMPQNLGETLSSQELDDLIAFMAAQK